MSGFQFTACCPTCAGPLTSDWSTVGTDTTRGPSVVASCGCGAVWMLRATILPAAVCGTCGAAYDSPKGLAVHLGQSHPNRYEEPAVEADEAPRPDPQAWRTEAACLGMDPELFAPPPLDLRKPPGRQVEEQIRKAKAVCAGCPVVADCLEDADRPTLDLTIRGGMTVEERSNAKRRARRSSASLPVEEVA